MATLLLRRASHDFLDAGGVVTQRVALLFEPVLTFLSPDSKHRVREPADILTHMKEIDTLTPLQYFSGHRMSLLEMNLPIETAGQTTGIGYITKFERQLTRCLDYSLDDIDRTLCQFSLLGLQHFPKIDRSEPFSISVIDS